MYAAGKGLIERETEVRGDNENVLCGDAYMPNRYPSLLGGSSILSAHKLQRPVFVKSISTNLLCLYFVQMPRCQDLTIFVPTDADR